MSKVSSLISKMRKLRSEATPTPYSWDEKYPFALLPANKITWEQGVKTSDKEFICAAANHTETLLKIIEVQREALSEIAGYTEKYDTMIWLTIRKFADDALAEAERLAGGLSEL